MDGARAIKFERHDLCWPLLFHAEPLLASYSWASAIEVTVTGTDGRHVYPDVASAQAATQQPPHRVELYAVFRDGADLKVGLWVVGFAPGQQPAATVDVEQGMGNEGRDLRDSVAEFLSDDTEPPVAAPVAGPVAGPAAGTAQSVPQGRWRLIANQPWTVQVIGGVIATLLASAVVALVTLLFR